MCPTAVDTHHSNRPSPDISVLFSIPFAASLSLWPDFAGLDHYSCRSLSPREQFIPPLQKDIFFFFFPTTTSPKIYTYAWLWNCLWMCDGRIRGSAVRDCDSEDVAFCREFKVRESETEQRRASLQLSGCRVASWRFSVKTNNRKNNTNGNIEQACVCFYLCLRQLLHFTRLQWEIYFLFFPIFFLFLLQCSFSAVSPGLWGKQDRMPQCLLLGLRSRSNLGRRPKFTFAKGKGTDTKQLLPNFKNKLNAS